MERLRWRIAYHLDRLRGQCWVDLVTWALDGIRKRGLPFTSSERCQEDARSCGACYCGKFRTRDGFTVNDPPVPGWRMVGLPETQPERRADA